MECPSCGTPMISSLKIWSLDGSHTEQHYCPRCDSWKPHRPGDRGWPKVNASPRNLDGPEEAI